MIRVVLDLTPREADELRSAEFKPNCHVGFCQEALTLDLESAAIKLRTAIDVGAAREREAAVIRSHVAATIKSARDAGR